MTPFFGPLTNVPVGTADVLAYAMLVVVAIFLLSAAGVSYYYVKKRRRMNPGAATPA